MWTCLVSLTSHIFYNMSYKEGMRIGFMIKNRYKDDYTKSARLNERGRIVDDICYVGDYYILPFDKEAKKKTNVVNLLTSVLLLSAQIIAGLLNADSSRTFWIVFPYMFVFLPIGYMFVGAVSYMGSPLKMQKAHYEMGLLRIRRSVLGAMVLEGINVILDMIYILIHFENVTIGKELVYLLCHIVFIGIAFLYGRYYTRTYGRLIIEKSQNKLE